MFGYIRPYVPDLRVREHEMYKSLYCGLCRSMGIHTGLFSRLTLNYDIVFLAAVRIALTEEKTCPVIKRCMVHPLEKRACCKDNAALEYSSAVSALLFYYKLADNVDDNRGMKRLGYKLLLPFASSFMNKAVKRRPIPVDEVEGALKQLKELESSQSRSLDNVADCFGAVLANLFGYGLEGNAKLIAESIGKSVGRYIYVIDAVDDLEDDKKTGNYNAVLLSGIKRDELKIPIRLELERLSRTIELIDFSENVEIGEIIKNIIYEGLVKTSNDVFTGKTKKGKSK